MTFIEAAIAVLTKEGKPLHVEELTRIVLESELLSHVGKTPQEVMESRLLAMAQKASERKIGITAPHTFCLTDWGMAEDKDALDVPIIDTYEKNTGPLLRGRERDPAASASKVRIAGRGERTHGQWREENPERRRNHEKTRAISDAILDILTACRHPMTPVDLAAAARDRDLIGDDLGADALVHALLEDNRKRADSGRKALFAFLPSGEIALAELEAAATAEKPESAMSAQKLLAAIQDQRRSIVHSLRRRLGELDGQAFDKVIQALLERMGFNDLKIARRNRDGAVFLGRKKEGVLELRYAIRVIRGMDEVDASDVEEHGKGLAQFGSQLGIVISAGDAGRDCRQAALASQPPVFLYCGDALAQLCFDKSVGVSRATVEIFDLDEEFFRKNGDPCRDDRERRKGAQQQQNVQQKDDRKNRGQQQGPGAQGKDQQKGKNQQKDPQRKDQPRDQQKSGNRREESGNDEGVTPKAAPVSDSTGEEVTAPDAPPAAEGEVAGEGGDEPKKLSRRQLREERNRQKKEAKAEARRLAALCKAKAAAEAAAKAAASADVVVPVPEGFALTAEDMTGAPKPDGKRQDSADGSKSAEAASTPSVEAATATGSEAAAAAATPAPVPAPSSVASAEATGEKPGDAAAKKDSAGKAASTAKAVMDAVRMQKIADDMGVDLSDPFSADLVAAIASTKSASDVPAPADKAKAASKGRSRRKTESDAASAKDDKAATATGDAPASSAADAAASAHAEAAPEEPAAPVPTSDSDAGASSDGE